MTTYTDDDWQFDEMARLRELLRDKDAALEIERERMRSLIDVLREMNIEVWFSPDGLMVQDTRLESVLHLVRWRSRCEMLE